MNYSKIYNDLIIRATNRSVEGYVESHHIIPKCIGGSDLKENKVNLTAEEHYIAHLLLVKMYPNEIKLVYAANMMANRNNKAYSWARKVFAAKHAANIAGRNHTDLSKKKMSISRKGIPKPSYHKEAISKSKLKSIEYKGIIYLGYKSLFDSTGVSSYLYKKFYLQGIDPEPFVGNNLYGMIKKNKEKPAKAALGKKWFNNGTHERYAKEPFDETWKLGRLQR